MPETTLATLSNIRTVQDMIAAFRDEEHCRRLLESMVWPNGRICPACGYKRSIAISGHDVGKRRARPGLYQCSSGGSVANIFDGCEEDFLRFVHAGLALKFCSSIATTSVSALGPMLKARSTMRASPRMSPVKLKIAAWPLRRARMTSKPLIVA